jgi:PhzF family phenazine biosynthesis protein
MSLPETKGYPFMMVNAFSQDIFGGNPAAVLFLDKMLPTETLSGIGQNFNQPMTAVLSPSIIESDDRSVINFDIRYFAPSGTEMPICGHATIAAARALSESGDAAQVKTIQFITASGALFAARRVDGDEGWFEISLPAAEIVPLSTEKQAEISNIVARAVGRESVQVKFAASGIEGFFAQCLMIVLDEKEDLAGIKLTNMGILVGFISNHDHWGVNKC